MCDVLMTVRSRARLTSRAATFHRPNSLINAPQIDVPEVMGMPAADAQDKLEDLGFTVVSGGAIDSYAAAGQAASSSPEAGARVSNGSSITLYTSNGAVTTLKDYVAAAPRRSTSLRTTSKPTDSPSSAGGKRPPTRTATPAGRWLLTWRRDRV
jgi:beta-lactam-binding protein with PASTA domain